MELSDTREYSGKILLSPSAITTPQIILDCGIIRQQQAAWISTYAALPGVTNPPPIFYSNPGWLFFLESLQINYFAASLASTPGLDLKANSSEADKLKELNARRRDNKRFELTILERNQPSDSWQRIGMEDLFNYGNRLNYVNIKNPFLSQGDVDLFGSTSQLAVQFSAKDISRKIELPTSDDLICIRGAWRSQVSL